MKMPFEQENDAANECIANAPTFVMAICERIAEDPEAAKRRVGTLCDREAKSLTLSELCELHGLMSSLSVFAKAYTAYAGTRN